MKKILVAGDSLGMVRPEEGLFVEDIYPYLLQKNLFNDFFVINASQRANNSSRIVSEDYLYENINAIRPDVVILHVGIVDCTPRVFSEIQKKLLAGMARVYWIKPFVSWFVKRRSLRRYDLTKKRKIVHVSLSDFEINLVKFFERARFASPDARFIVVNILYPGCAMTSRNYGLVENVNDYNRKLTEIAAKYSSRVINLFDFTRIYPEVVLPDGHHIGKVAHQFIAQEAFKVIKAGGFQ